jgi:hypothetical protein
MWRWKFDQLSPYVRIIHLKAEHFCIHLKREEIWDKWEKNATLKGKVLVPSL